MADGNFDKLTVTGNVGIGTQNPGSYRLMVAGGDLRIAEKGKEASLFGLDRLVGLNDLRFYVDDVGNSEKMHLDAGQLRLECALRIEKNDIWLLGGHNGIGWYGPGRIWKEAGEFSIAPDGPVIFGYAGGVLGTTASGKKRCLSWDDNGDVWVYGDLTTSRDLKIYGNVTAKGDVFLEGADCAEDFNITCSEPVEAGTVMVIDEEGALQPSQQAYDKRVAGVISGAGSLRPGIILDKQQDQTNRLPLALVGKVYCKVDASNAPIEVGDLLTTSPTPGHGMKASNPLDAFGAVIGKALGALADGQGMIPILVALQ